MSQSFKENPNLDGKVITLANGGQEYRNLVAKIKGSYYIKNKECFEVDGKWYREASGLIVKDHETGSWFMKETMPFNLINGVIGSKDGSLIMGYFTRNPYNNVKVYSGFGNIDALNKDILAEGGYIEDISTGVWYRRSKYTASELRSFDIIKNKIDNSGKGYNIEDNVTEMSLKTQYYNAYPIELSKDVRRYARMLNDVSFGIELEVSHGYLPENLQNRMGLVACRDGSIKDENGIYPPEFVSIPLSGAKGLQNIVNISNELKKRTLINEKCSLHLHLGNIPSSRLFIVSMYVLGVKIQDEIFKMFPYYKTDWTVSRKEKDYCQKLKKMGIGILKPSSKEDYEKYVNDNYNKIFYFLSQNATGSGYNPSKECNRKQNVHPVNQKYNRKNRYYWLNLMNLIFSKRNTVEFRVHTPTVNSQKIINWLFICNAITKYAIANSREILTSAKKISLSDVLDYYKNTFRIPQAAFLSEYLKAYVKERTEYFATDFKNGNYMSKEEMLNDKTYTFTFENQTNLF